MTKLRKLRTPDSIEDAVKQASALLGNDAISTALTAIGLRASPSLIDKWSDIDAAQTPSLAQALAIETLLIKTGNAAIFVDLFVRLQPLPPAALVEARPDPVREAMRATSSAVELMEKVDAAMIDGRLSKGELTSIEKCTHAAQKQIARLRRVVRAALDLPPAR
jgi:hypothetical protein